MIRILHIVNRVASDGATKQLTQLIGAVSNAEFDFHVCSLDEVCNDSCRFGIADSTVRRHGRIDPLAFNRLRQHIRQLRPDIVHTWQFDAGVYGRAAAFSVGIRRLIASEQDIDRDRTGLERAIDRRLAARTRRVVTNSIAVQDYCIGRGLPERKLVFIPKAVQAAEPARLSRSEFLAQLGLPAEAKLILYLGPLVKEKRLKELIWAADQLKAVGVPAHLLVVGDGPLRWRLERFRWQNRIDDRVHFLGSRCDVAEFLAHADVLWQAGHQEGQSSAILEAMAAGVPVVAADAAGNRELVIHGETGYLVPLKERASFARWTLPLVEDAELGRRIGEAGRRRTEQNHQVQEMAGKHTRLYQQVMAQ